jgi:L-lactate dehydrogenase complex protein LldG
MDTAQTLDQFTSSLDRLEVGWTRTDVASFLADLKVVVEPPAVGAPLRFEDVSLEGSDVILDPTPAEIEDARTGVTAARMGIADYGSVVIEGAGDATEAASLFPETHVAVLRAADVVPDMATAFEAFGPLLREEPRSFVLATGPSATADMGALVKGAHGPKAVHVLILE